MDEGWKVIKCDGGEVVEIFRITPEKKLIINPAFSVDDAAKEFWDAVTTYAPHHGYSVEMRTTP